MLPNMPTSPLSSYMLLVLVLGYASPHTKAGKNESSVEALSEVMFDDDDEEDESSTSWLELGLCVPQDRLEDIDFTPNLDDDWIRLDDAFEKDYAKDSRQDSAKHPRQDLAKHPRQDSAKDSRKDSAEDSCDGHDNGQVEEIRANFTSMSVHPLDSNENYDNGQVEERPNFTAMSVHPLDSYEHYDFKRPFEYTNLSLYMGREDRRKFPLLTKKPRTKKWARKLIKGGEMVRYSGMKRGRKRSSELSNCRKRIKRCSHCEAVDTPQWRLGPLGPNTLCNACGLRYKVGRLLENYRPAASPSFDMAKHSNYYKRIMRQNSYIYEAIKVEE